MSVSPHRLTESELRRLFTGLVVESLAVKQDFDRASVGCRACPDGATQLTVGDRVTVAVTCYEDHSWEIESVYCTAHDVTSVADTMGIRAENQAVGSAVLEATGYHPPRGNFQPDALTLGEVEIVDYSPSAEGY